MEKIKGFTFVDVLIGTALLTLIIVGVSTSFRLLLKVSSQSQSKIVALALANEQIEIARNLPYQNVGASGGIPAGELPQTKTKKIDEKTYTIATDIIYIDDSFDKVAPEDEFPADYKKIRIEVSWLEEETKSVIQIANISPPNLESEVEGATLSLFINDSQSGEAVPSARVKISNDQVEPAVYLTTITDENGWLSRPGLAESDNYQIIVSKTDYDEHKTYDSSPSFNPEPEYSHAQLIQGEKTTRYLTISKTSALIIKTVDEENQPLSGISFALKGGRAIGTNPANGETVYSYQDDDLATDDEGENELSNMSGGEYYLEITEPNYTVLSPNLENPLIIESDSQELINIVLRAN